MVRVRVRVVAVGTFHPAADGCATRIELDGKHSTAACEGARIFSLPITPGAKGNESSAVVVEGACSPTSVVPESAAPLRQSPPGTTVATTFNNDGEDEHRTLSRRKLVIRQGSASTCASSGATTRHDDSPTGGHHHLPHLPHPHLPHLPQRFSLRRVGSKSASSLTATPKVGAAEAAVDPLDWGFPGFLSAEEERVFERFRAEVQRRPEDFRSTVYSFGEVEGDQALCRWLRARKFQYDDVVSMVEQATLLRAEPSKADFYPTARGALGVSESIYKSQYPQLYYGYAKNGCPVWISKPGVLNISGCECITTVEQIHRYQWHCMIHPYGSLLRRLQSTNPNFERFQSVVILDLNGLSRDAINKRAMDLIQHQSVVDSLCFPEALNRMVVVNAPSYFALTWRVIKRWLDPRTSAKVEIYSGRSRWEKRLQELIDVDQLPSDYGGTGESTVDTISQMNNDDEGKKVDRRITETMTVRHHASTVLELDKGETMEIQVFTRAAQETLFSVENVGHRHHGAQIVSNVKVKFHGGDECLETTLASGLIGPGKFRVSADSDRGRISSAEHYLLVGNIVKA